MKRRPPRKRPPVPNAEIEAVVRANRFAALYNRLGYHEQRRTLRWLLDRCGKSQDEPKF